MFLIIRRKHVLTVMCIVLIAVLAVVFSSRVFRQGEALPASALPELGLGIFRRGEASHRQRFSGISKAV